MRVLIDNANRSYDAGVQIALVAAGIQFESVSNRGQYPNRRILVEESDYPRALEAVATVTLVDDDAFPLGARHAAWALIALFIIAWVVMFVRR